VMPWDGWMGVSGFGDGGRPSQRNAKHQQLPDHVFIFGRESPRL
jgi:hypothetical protein